MGKDSGKIGTIEKRELANIIAREFQDVISGLKQNEEELQKECLEKIAHKFRAEIVIKEIATLQVKIDFLKNKLRDFGFELDNSGTHINGFLKTYQSSGRWSGGYIVDRSTPAGRIFYSMVKHQPDIEYLTTQQNDVLKKIWLEETREGVKKLMEEKPNLKGVKNDNRSVRSLRDSGSPDNPISDDEVK